MEGGGVITFGGRSAKGLFSLAAGGERANAVFTKHKQLKAPTCSVPPVRITKTNTLSDTDPTRHSVLHDYMFLYFTLCFYIPGFVSPSLPLFYYSAFYFSHTVIQYNFHAINKNRKYNSFLQTHLSIVAEFSRTFSQPTVMEIQSLLFKNKT